MAVPSAPAQLASAPQPAPALRAVDILKFHAPIAATIFCYSIVFNIINSTMARTGTPAASLAGFAVAQSLVDLLAGPAGMGNQLLLARGRDRRSLAVGLRVMLQIVTAVTIAIAVVAWTPISRWLYIGVFRAPEHLFDGINGAVKVCVLMPLLWAFRNSSQAILMLRRRTHLMAGAVGFRLVIVTLAARWLLTLQGYHGATLGGMLWIIGMAAESAVLVPAAAILAKGLPPEPAPGTAPPTYRALWRFLLPLIAMFMFWTLTRPLINASLARTGDGETAIAAFQIAWHAAFLLLALQMDFRHAVVVFWADDSSLATIKRFSLQLGLLIGGLMLVAGVSGLGGWFLQSVLGAPPALAGLAGMLLAFVSPLPVLSALLEVRGGQLLRNGATTGIAVAKACNVVVAVSVMMALTALLPGLGPRIAVLGMVTAAAAETGVLVYLTRAVPGDPAPG